MGEHGGYDGGDVVHEVGGVFADVFDDDGAGGGEVDAVVGLLEEAFGAVRDDFCPEGRFGDFGEAEFFDGGDEGFGGDVAEFADVGGGQGEEDAFVLLEGHFGPGEAVADFFGAGGAHLGAVAAVDAAFLDDGGFVVLHADGFHGAFPDAFIAVLAVVRLGVYGSQLHGNSSCSILYRRERLTSS